MTAVDAAVEQRPVFELFEGFALASVLASLDEAGLLAALEAGPVAAAPDGVPDAEWCARVIKLLEDQQIDTLIKESTQHQMLKAGNVGGELLNWIAMLGAIGHRKPNYVAPQMQNGHAYGVWRWN